MMYAKNPGEIRKSKLWSAANLNISAMLEAILKKKVDENHLGTERILYAENSINIGHCPGGETVHTDTRVSP